MITLRWLHNSLFNRFNLPAVSKFIISRAIYNSVYIVAPVNHHLRKLFFYLSFLRHFYLGHAILYRLNNRIFQANTIVLYGRVPTRKSHSSYYSVLRVLRWRCEVVSWKKIHQKWSQCIWPFRDSLGDSSVKSVLSHQLYNLNIFEWDVDLYWVWRVPGDSLTKCSIIFIFK